MRKWKENRADPIAEPRKGVGGGYPIQNFQIGEIPEVTAP
jgi:hypothetical protein